MTVCNSLPDAADESQQNEFLRKEIKLLKAKLLQSEQERMLAKTDWFVASQELIAQRKELEVCEQQRTQLEQRVNVQDVQLIQKREEIESMSGEKDLLKKKLNEFESKSTFMERLARFIPRQMDMDSTGPICDICDCEYNGKRIPKVLRCGHTLCIECAGRIAGAFHIRCPFDRTDTPMNDGVRSLSTNFTLVEILEQRPWPFFPFSEGGKPGDVSRSYPPGIPQSVPGGWLLLQIIFRMDQYTLTVLDRPIPKTTTLLTHRPHSLPPDVRRLPHSILFSPNRSPLLPTVRFVPSDLVPHLEDIMYHQSNPLYVVRAPNPVDILHHRIGQLEAVLSAKNYETALLQDKWNDVVGKLVNEREAWKAERGTWAEERAGFEKRIQVLEAASLKSALIDGVNKIFKWFQPADNSEGPPPVCHICEFEYGETRTPKLLNCGHTECEGCCDRLAINGFIKCPFDQQNTAALIGAWCLRNNYSLIEIMEDLKNRKREAAKKKEKKESFNSSLTFNLSLLVGCVVLLFLLLVNNVNK